MDTDPEVRRLGLVGVGANQLIERSGDSDASAKDAAQAFELALEFHAGAEPVRVKRLLERPFGSVRWNEEAPDPGSDGALPFH